MSQIDAGLLDAELRQAHASADGQKLSALYCEAANYSEAEGQIDAACFHLTHAYVFALENGLDTSFDIYKRLRNYGREE